MCKVTKERVGVLAYLVNQRRKRRRECSWAKGREREGYVIEVPTDGANWVVNGMR
jgi:hypothetical protein